MRHTLPACTALRNLCALAFAISGPASPPPPATQAATTKPSPCPPSRVQRVPGCGPGQAHGAAVRLHRSEGELLACLPRGSVRGWLACWPPAGRERLAALLAASRGPAQPSPLCVLTHTFMNPPCRRRSLRASSTLCWSPRQALGRGGLCAVRLRAKLPAAHAACPLPPGHRRTRAFQFVITTCFFFFPGALQRRLHVRSPGAHSADQGPRCGLPRRRRRAGDCLRGKAGLQHGMPRCLPFSIVGFDLFPSFPRLPQERFPQCFFKPDQASRDGVGMRCAALNSIALQCERHMWLPAHHAVPHAPTCLQHDLDTCQETDTGACEHVWESSRPHMVCLAVATCRGLHSSCWPHMSRAQGRDKEATERCGREMCARMGCMCRSCAEGMHGAPL